MWVLEQNRNHIVGSSLLELRHWTEVLFDILQTGPIPHPSNWYRDSRPDFQYVDRYLCMSARMLIKIPFPHFKLFKFNLRVVVSTAIKSILPFIRIKGKAIGQWVC
jgi:hypothetical protein